MLVRCYATGDEANASKKFLYFITDVIGIDFINAQLIADEYAKKGYYVLAPDVYFADPVKLNPPASWDLVRDWLPHHQIKDTQPIVDKVSKGVVEKYNPKFSAAVGFCFGAKYAIRLLGTGILQSASVFHPSLVELDEVKAIKGSLLITAPDDDYIYVTELRHKTEEVLKELGASKGLKYRQNLLHGVGHGFSIRGDISDPWVKYCKEKAFADTVEWFAITAETGGYLTKI